MTSGRIDMDMVSDKYSYMIVYSETDKANEVNTWVLPEGSFIRNYKSMMKRGCIIHNVFRRMTQKDLIDVLLKD